MKRNTIITAILAVTIAISIAATGVAKPFGGGKPEHGPGGGIRALMSLDLSQDQKHEIYDILQNYEGEQQKTRETMRSQRRIFQAVTSGPDFNEEDVRRSFQEMVPAMEDAHVLKAKVHSEVMAVLTDAQLEELQDAREERASRRHGMKNKGFRRAMLETWLTMDGEKQKYGLENKLFSGHFFPIRDGMTNKKKAPPKSSGRAFFNVH